MSTTRQLLAPLTYLRIKHDAKAKYDWWYPVLLTILSVVVYYLLPVRFFLTGSDGLLGQVQELIQLLIGFYILALSIVATFDVPNLDVEMKGAAPTLKEPRREDGQIVTVRLTRRRYLSFLFGYLSLLSLVFFLMVMLVNIVHPSLAKSCSASVAHVLRFVGVGVFGFLFWQMIVITLQGLFFLIDRIHRD